MSVTEIRVLEWVLEVDPEATARAYTALPSVAESCGCVYCRNYAAASPHLPGPMKRLLAQLGIDPPKASETYETCENEDGTHLYGGFYHLVGRMVEGRDCMVPVESEGARIVRIRLSRLADHFEVGFTASLSLVPAGFPHPVLQMEFTGNLPWVIDERP